MECYAEAVKFIIEKCKECGNPSIETTVTELITTGQPMCPNCAEMLEIGSVVTIDEEKRLDPLMTSQDAVDIARELSTQLDQKELESICEVSQIIWVNSKTKKDIKENYLE